MSETSNGHINGTINGVNPRINPALDGASVQVGLPGLQSGLEDFFEDDEGGPEVAAVAAVALEAASAVVDEF